MGYKLQLGELEKVLDNYNALKNDMGDQKSSIHVRLSEFNIKLDENKGDAKEQIGAEINTLFLSLKTEITEIMKENEAKVNAAENHVENLRSLNGTLIDRVKDNMKNHEDEQTKI